MKKTAIENKIVDLEAKIKLLKESVRKQPSFSVDEKNWEKVKPEAKKTRKRLFKKVYG